MSKLKVNIYCLLLVLLGLGLVRLYLNLTDDFQLAHIYLEEPIEIALNIEPISKVENDQVDALLDQPFFYIGKGSQSYVFASKDQKYVLKFFKFKHLKKNWLIDILGVFPFLKEYQQKVIARKIRKIKTVFKSHELAFNYNKEASGLIFLHFENTNRFKKPIIIYDKIGLKREVDLDHVFFVIQKNGETLRNRLRHLLKEGNVDAAKETLSKMIALFVDEYKRGLYDSDTGIMQNTGFVGDQPFHLDIGHLTKNEQMKDVNIYKTDLERHVRKMAKWIHSNFKSYFNEFSEFLEQEYYRQTDSKIQLA